MAKVNTLKDIETLVSNANKSKQNYYNSLQKAVDLFLAEYNTSLNRNSTPLLMIFKSCGKEIQAMKQYITTVSNISDFNLTKDKGLKLSFKKDSIQDKDKPLQARLDSGLTWFSIAKNDSVKAVMIELTQESLLKSIKRLVKRLEESKIDKKEDYIKILNKIK